MIKYHYPLQYCDLHLDFLILYNYASQEFLSFYESQINFESCDTWMNEAINIILYQSHYSCFFVFTFLLPFFI